MTQFVRALAAAVFGLLLGLVTPLAAAAAPALPSPSYDYYGAEVIDAAPLTTTERGPPAHVQGDLTYDPDGLRLLGLSTRQIAPTTRTAYDYDDLTRLVQSTSDGLAVQERSDGPVVGPFVVQRWDVAANGAARLNVQIGTKIEKQMGKRGWTRDSVEDLINNPARTVRTRDTRHLPGGGRNDAPATAYINRGGGYVVRNDETGDIVQVSNLNDPNWKSPW